MLLFLTKRQCCSNLDEVDLMSRKAGAVNTVASITGKFKGFNTDIQGFIQPLYNHNIDFKGLSTPSSVQVVRLELLSRLCLPSTASPN